MEQRKTSSERNVILTDCGLLSEQGGLRDRLVPDYMGAWEQLQGAWTLSQVQESLGDFMQENERICFLLSKDESWLFCREKITSE